MRKEEESEGEAGTGWKDMGSWKGCSRMDQEEDPGLSGGAETPIKDCSLTTGKVQSSTGLNTILGWV